MFKLIISAVVCIYVATLFGEGEALTCYHCYDSFNNTLSISSLQNDIYSDKFIRCDKNLNNWNTWECPPKYPICVIMSARVKDHTEIIRTCGERDICKTYRPFPSVTLETCRECNATLCNDFVGVPVPPTSTFTAPYPTTATEPPYNTTTTEPPYNTTTTEPPYPTTATEPPYNTTTTEPPCTTTTTEPHYTTTTSSPSPSSSTTTPAPPYPPTPPPTNPKILFNFKINVILKVNTRNKK